MDTESQAPGAMMHTVPLAIFKDSTTLLTRGELTGKAWFPHPHAIRQDTGKEFIEF